MQLLLDTRSALLALHRSLLEAQRVEVERVSGRLTANQLLQAATEDLRFSWLKELSELIAELDRARADGEPTDGHLDRARALLTAPDAGAAFGSRYLQALQDDPAVVFAHRDAVAALN